MAKFVITRVDAREDVRDITDRLQRERGPQAADDFSVELSQAYNYIGSYPSSGSLHYARLLKRPGLRHRLLVRSKYLVFYMEHAEHVVVWRVLHHHRDIPTLMRLC